jgi:hypothetical protein
LWERLGAANPPRITLAKKIAAERKKQFQQLETLLAQARIRRDRIEKILKDQQAGFAQAELVRFIRSRRAAHAPRSLASAMAGLPEISARVSFKRCRKFPFLAGQSLNFQIFTFIERCLKRRTSLNPVYILQLFRSEIGRMPKTQFVGGRRVENFFRKHLEENWWALKASISHCLESRRHPGEMPFVVSDVFLRHLAKPLTSLDRLLLEDEKVKA